MIKMKATNILLIFCLGLITMGVSLPKSLNAALLDPRHIKELDIEEVDRRTQVKETTNKAQEEITRPKIEYKAQGLKDPFLPIGQEKEITGFKAHVSDRAKPLPELTLQGLVWGGVFPQAIINNQLVKIGDLIGEAEVVEIEKEGVTLLYDEKRQKLSSPAVTGPRKKEKTKGGSNENAH